MTRTLRLDELCCTECGHCYDSVEEAIECEELDREERRLDEEIRIMQEEWEILTDAELDQRRWEETDGADLLSRYGGRSL